MSRALPSSRRRRLGAGLALIIAGASLGSCAQPPEFLTPVVDFFGPRPDPQLLDLARQAQIDAAAWAAQDPAAAARREETVTALLAEIHRLCGHHSDGTLPASCTVDLTVPDPAAAPAHAGPAEAAEDLLAAQVPDSSQPVIAAQAISLLELATSPEHELDLAEHELDLAAAAADPGLRADMTEMLHWCRATAWGLDSARAYSDPAAEAEIDNTIAHIERTELQLRAVVDAPEEITAQFYPQPTAGLRDSASAAAYVAELRQALMLRWTTAASTWVNGPEASAPWRLFAATEAAALSANR